MADHLNHPPVKLGNPLARLGRRALLTILVATASLARASSTDPSDVSSAAGSAEVDSAASSATFDSSAVPIRIAASTVPARRASPAVAAKQGARTGSLSPADAAYLAELAAWRKEQDDHLRADDGWLTVAGLYWLKEGANRFGTDASNEFVLPPGSAPARAGTLQFHAGTTTLEMAPGVTATVDSKPVTRLELKPDASGKPDVVALGALKMFVIKRQDRYGIRLKDNASPARKAFAGRTWFPPDPAYRVNATWVAYNPPHSIPVANVLGQTEPMTCPGYASFSLEGRELRLEPVLEDPKATDLFYILRDGTSGKETYGAGRFLYSDLPKDGKVVLDFNKAYSPPCAFTDFATCPLPPKQNHLPVRIEAGETSTAHH